MVLAIILGFILYMLIGMVYYAVVGKRWLDFLDIKPEQPNYGMLTLVTLLTTLFLYGVLQLSQAETALDGAFIGGLVGIIVALAYAKDFIFGLGANSKRPLAVYFIAVGYHVLALTIIGTVMMFFV